MIRICSLDTVFLVCTDFPIVTHTTFSHNHEQVLKQFFQTMICNVDPDIIIPSQDFVMMPNINVNERCK
jgi:hypothetical protein